MDQLDAIVAAKAAGVSEELLQESLEFQRKAQWRLDFIAAENSMGFHAPQEASRILGEAADYARQGQVAAMNAEKGFKNNFFYFNYYSYFFVQASFSVTILLKTRFSEVESSSNAK